VLDQLDCCLPAVDTSATCNWRDFGTSRWQLRDHATKFLRHLKRVGPEETGVRAITGGAGMDFRRTVRYASPSIWRPTMARGTAKWFNCKRDTGSFSHRAAAGEMSLFTSRPFSAMLGRRQAGARREMRRRAISGGIPSSEEQALAEVRPRSQSPDSATRIARERAGASLYIKLAVVPVGQCYYRCCK
jgi:hypothetical protein